MTNSNSGNIVIVESPTKARTITPMLGGGYTILASMGHIRDLPKNSLGIDIKNNFTPLYTDSKSSIIKNLAAASKNAERIYLATDPDREGEAISWHIKEILAGKTKAQFFRLEFHEITKNAIKKAFEHVRDIDINLVDSQQARRVLDRLVGYQLSPLLWSRIEKNISAGRVQSVALRIVCEREREIQNFIPQEYWDFGAKFIHDNKNDRAYEAKLIYVNNKKVAISNKEEARKVYDEIKGASKFYISSAKTEPVKRHAPAPFITSTLQQSAGTSMRFSSSKTMQIAQQLYEGIQLGNGELTGLITYMRTDSFTISKEAQIACRDFIGQKFGQKYIPPQPNFFKNKSSAQEAHEAIRPSDVYKTPESIAAYLSKDQLNLYKLIWKRFVASQMSSAELSRTTIDTQCDGASAQYTFRALSTITLFDGFTVILSDKNDKNDNDNKYPFFQFIKQNDLSALVELTKEQKFTEPPPRYTEPSLIKELEANGIGRPSTYATIINTIQNRKYVEKKEGKLFPQDLGFRVNDYLVGSFPELFNISFTSEMEEKLDSIESGSTEWRSVIKDFYEGLQGWMKEAKYDSAPTQDKAQAALEILNNFEGWEKPDKKQGRVFDDKKFFVSIQKQYQKNNAITAKQFSSVLRIICKYYSQIKDIEAFISKYNLKQEIDEMLRQISAETEKREQLNEERAESANAMKPVLELLRNSELTPNPSFDERKFIDSLSEQLNNNRALSPKQIYVLKRIAVRNKENILSFDTLSSSLGISEKELDTMDSKNETPKESNPKIDELIAALDKVTDWKSDGKRKINDKSFFASLKKQYQSKKSLSIKQLAALEKIAAKYKQE